MYSYNFDNSKIIRLSGDNYNYIVRKIHVSTKNVLRKCQKNQKLIKYLKNKYIINCI